MNKTVNVVFPASDDASEMRSAPINVGTTPSDILRAAGRDPQNWELQLKRRDGFEALARQDDVYSKVQDGEVLFVAPTDMVVG